MVAVQFANSVIMMTPGTTSMLRARRKDANVRPNRLLDRTASRGMLYENEDLRLRTININADLEKGCIECTLSLTPDHQSFLRMF